LSPAAEAAVIRLARGLRQQATDTYERRTLIIAGSDPWTLTTTERVLAQEPDAAPAWLTERQTAGRHLGVSDGAQLLGTELDTLVYDAHSGVDPDSLGAALGALRGGGLLILLTPPLDAWPAWPDPQASRIAVHPYTADRLSGRFVRRLVRILRDAPATALVQQGLEIPPPPPVATRCRRGVPEPSGEARTADQAAAVEAIIATARGRARRPLVLTSDRGRGKSAALGIAAARLLSEAPRRILVTAPRHLAVEPIFRHAARLLSRAKVRAGRIDQGAGVLEFMSPDVVATGRPANDLLLIDEAAGIPAPLLETMLRHHRRLVFATTVHGYEGTGRGFDVRFRGTLDRLTPGWYGLTLKTPIRWAATDPVEALVARALLLGAAPAAEGNLADAVPESCRFECLDRDALAQEEPILSQVFGLLVLAHYQTRPMDLRHLLDGPNLRVYTLYHGTAVAATALVAAEGGLDAELARAVFEGRRRPRGHLLPQTLSAHAGLEEAPRLRLDRIVRIAVHPAAQGRGLGRRLLNGIVEQAQGLGRDAVGASFGATADLLAFWGNCGFAPIHLGTSRNAASGAHAAVVLSALTPAGRDLHTRGRRHLRERLPTLLAGPLRELDPVIAARLLEGTGGARAALEPGELRELEAFAYAVRPYEAVLPVLSTLVSERIGKAPLKGFLTDRERDVLVAKVLQHRSWGETAEMGGASGRAQVLSILRGATGKLLRLDTPPQT
jgi:tRNA(Met) cytidine acetyltransferase